MMVDFSILKTIGLTGFMETLPATAAFVVDAEIYEYLAALPSYGGVLCRLSDMATLRGLKSSHIYVLSRACERGHVKALSAQYPEADVASVTYDIIPGLALLSEGQSFKDEENGPRIMVVAPGSGFEAFSHALRTARVADFQEHVTPALYSWFGYYRDFSFVRFIAAIMKRRIDRRLDSIFGMDVLLGMLEDGLIRPSYIKRLFKSLDGEILYFANRDKCREAVVHACLAPTGFRTQGDVPEGMREDIFGTEPDMGQAFEQLILLLDAEFKLETLMEQLANLKFITMWDMNQNSIAVVENVALFLNEDVRGPVEKTTDIWLDEIPVFVESVQQLKNRMAGLINVDISSLS